MKDIKRVLLALPCLLFSAIYSVAVCWIVHPKKVYCTRPLIDSNPCTLPFIMRMYRIFSLCSYILF